MPSSSTLSLRLPEETRERLDRVAKKSRRSRSYIIQRALELHLDDVAKEETPPKETERFARLLSMQGAGRGPEGGRTKQEIDSYIRWLRDDD